MKHDKLSVAYCQRSLQSLVPGSYLHSNQLLHRVFNLAVGDQQRHRKIWIPENIIAAMAICFTGCMMFVPAYYLNSYFLILLGVFTVPTGVTVINVAANPYAALLGIIADFSGIELSYMVPAFCILIVTFYGMFMHSQKSRGPLPMCAQPYMIHSCGVAILSSVSCVVMAKSIRYPFARLRIVQE